MILNDLYDNGVADRHTSKATMLTMGQSLNGIGQSFLAPNNQDEHSIIDLMVLADIMNLP